jgi:hypothetical protein
MNMEMEILDLKRQLVLVEGVYYVRFEVSKLEPIIFNVESGNFEF